MASKVVVIATGGTIAETVAGGGTTGSHLVLSLGGGDLVRQLGDSAASDVEVEDFLSLDSYAITLDQAFALAMRISAALARPDVTGVVVTHGTDTLEETCFLADVLVSSDKPAVFTGAMRPASEAGSDATRNLAAAIAVAGAPEARGLGVVAVLNEEVHAAGSVVKTHTSALQSFQSPGTGPLGVVVDGRPSIDRRPARRRPTLRAHRLDRRAELVRVAMDCSPAPIEALARSGIGGLVIEALGSGNVPPALLPSIGGALANGAVVAIASRIGSGAAVPVSASPGCGRSLADMGVLFAGRLPGHKVRLLLTVGLSAGLGRADIARLLDDFA